MDDRIQRLRKWIQESENIVFFGGAGVSTESGIPDFRSEDGLYSRKFKYPPETMLSHTFFETMPEEFFEFYKEKMNIDGIKPNAAHYRLAELERQGKVRAVVTQNIDGLHQLAGSGKVLELHGSMHRSYCVKCGARYGYREVRFAEGIPACTCGGTIRPDVVLYEEGLDSQVLNDAARYIRDADVLIVGGTSLVVYPAAGLVDLYSGDKLVLINKGRTSYDSIADLVINEKLGEVFGQV